VAGGRPMRPLRVMAGRSLFWTDYLEMISGDCCSVRAW